MTQSRLVELDGATGSARRDRHRRPAGVEHGGGPRRHPRRGRPAGRGADVVLNDGAGRPAGPLGERPARSLRVPQRGARRVHADGLAAGHVACRAARQRDRQRCPRARHPPRRRRRRFRASSFASTTASRRRTWARSCGCTHRPRSPVRRRRPSRRSSSAPTAGTRSRQLDAPGRLRRRGVQRAVVGRRARLATRPVAAERGGRGPRDPDRVQPRRLRRPSRRRPRPPAPPAPPSTTSPPPTPARPRRRAPVTHRDAMRVETLTPVVAAAPGARARWRIRVENDSTDAGRVPPARHRLRRGARAAAAAAVHRWRPGRRTSSTSSSPSRRRSPPGTTRSPSR